MIKFQSVDSIDRIAATNSSFLVITGLSCISRTENVDFLDQKTDANLSFI